ncbi:MAG: LPS assembly protein LptD [Pseudomonadota bacterium]
MTPACHLRTPIIAISRHIAAAFCTTLLASGAAAQESASVAETRPGLCSNPQNLISSQIESGITEGGDIRLESGRGSIAVNGDAILTDGVSASRGNFRIDAQQGRFERASNSLSLDGGIEYSGGGARIRSDRALLSYLYGRVEFSQAMFELGNGAARGSAGLLRINQSGTLRLESADYTTCPPGQNDWVFTAREINLDTDNGVGEARGLKLRFKGVPILYAPYLSFPISAKRKTGFLIPDPGQSSINGFDISVPWYWNISPAYDATLTPRILTRRGIQLDTTFRYLTPRSSGEAQVAHLPDDDLTGLDRTLLRWTNTTDFGGRWRAFADITDVSDSNYLEDLGGSLASASVTHLNRSLGVGYFGEHWRADARVTNFQTIDEIIGGEDLPYRILPGISVSGRWADLPGGFSFELDSEATRFDRSVGVTGNRMHFAPRLSLPIEGNGAYIKPSVAWSLTHYQLDENDTVTDRSQSRSLPIVSIDAGLKFERDTGHGRYRQTLEPRLYYVHVPFRDQDALPVFDTIQPITSIEQLYRENRFIGIDRIGDTDQVTLGLTSRLLRKQTGETVVTATIGQNRNLSTRSVTLPGVAPLGGNSSDYIAELAVNVWGNWNVDFAQQWNTENSRTSRSEVRLQYQPGRRRVVNLSYRFRRDSVEQGDISWSWPLASRWNLVGRYNYSFRENKPLERFFGIEYESCCWALRVVSRRFIRNRDGTSDSIVSLQLELKGLMSVGDPVNELLERGILGYRSTTD